MHFEAVFLKQVHHEIPNSKLMATAAKSCPYLVRNTAPALSLLHCYAAPMFLMHVYCLLRFSRMVDWLVWFILVAPSWNIGFLLLPVGTLGIRETLRFT
jgi:hypothetical protein